MKTKTVTSLVTALAEAIAMTAFLNERLAFAMNTKRDAALEKVRGSFPQVEVCAQELCAELLSGGEYAKAVCLMLSRTLADARSELFRTDARTGVFADALTYLEFANALSRKANP